MNINAWTITRTIILLIALINQFLSIKGMSPLPIEDEQVEMVVSTVATIAASLWAWWKNNSFTKAAVEADAYLAELKEKN